jgi:uncharacterized phage infection (PIP) family protein YhgE
MTESTHVFYDIHKIHTDFDARKVDEIEEKNKLIAEDADKLNKLKNLLIQLRTQHKEGKGLDLEKANQQIRADVKGLIVQVHEFMPALQTNRLKWTENEYDSLITNLQAESSNILTFLNSKYTRISQAMEIRNQITDIIRKLEQRSERETDHIISQTAAAR